MTHKTVLLDTFDKSLLSGYITVVIYYHKILLHKTISMFLPLWLSKALQMEETKWQTLPVEMKI